MLCNWCAWFCYISHSIVALSKMVHSIASMPSVSSFSDVCEGEWYYWLVDQKDMQKIYLNEDIIVLLFFIFRWFCTLGSVRESRIADKVEEKSFIHPSNSNSKFDENKIKFPAAKDSLAQLDDNFFPFFHYWSSEHLSYSSSERKTSRSLISDGMHWSKS